MDATSDFYPENIKWDPYYDLPPPMNIPYSSCTNQNPTTYSNQFYSDTTSDYQNPNYNHQNRPNLTVCTNFTQNSSEDFCQNYSNEWGNFEDTQMSFSPQFSASLTSQCSSAVPNPLSIHSDFNQVTFPIGTRAAGIFHKQIRQFYQISRKLRFFKRWNSIDFRSTHPTDLLRLQAAAARWQVRISKPPNIVCRIRTRTVQWCRWEGSEEENLNSLM